MGGRGQGQDQGLRAPRLVSCFCCRQRLFSAGHAKGKRTALCLPVCLVAGWGLVFVLSGEIVSAQPAASDAAPSAERLAPVQLVQSGQSPPADADRPVSSRLATGMVRALPADLSLRKLAQLNPFPFDLWGIESPLTPRQAELFRRLGVHDIEALLSAEATSVARILDFAGGSAEAAGFLENLRANVAR